METTLLNSVLALIIVGVILWLVSTRLHLAGNVQAVVRVIAGLIVIGIGLLLVNSFIPMAGSIKAILNIVVVVATCIGVLREVGLWAEIVRLWNNLTGHGVAH